MRYDIRIRATISFAVDVESTEAALAAANIAIQDNFPEGSEPTILSILREGVEIEAVEQGGKPDDPKPRPPSGRPNGGGSPGTPVIRAA